MKLFHTSPNEISQITRFGGRFDEFLFFSGSVYQMAACDVITYSLELSDEDVIEAGSLFYHDDAEKLAELIAEFCERFDVDESTAEEIISEREQLDSCDADELWDVQLFTARAAKLLGFRAVEVRDEQGAAWMVDMLGHETELNRED